MGTVGSGWVMEAALVAVVASMVAMVVVAVVVALVLKSLVMLVEG